VRRFVLLRHFISIVAIVFVLASPCLALAKPLTFGDYEVTSEKSDDWNSSLETKGIGSFEIFGAYTAKSGASKLFAFRKNDHPDKVCSQEFNLMRQNLVKFEKLPTPAGWSCVYEVKSENRQYGIRTYRIKGKHLEVDFATVLVAQDMNRERFMRAVKTAKRNKNLAEAK
jgi:hypothetical protein